MFPPPVSLLLVEAHPLTWRMALRTRDGVGKDEDFLDWWWKHRQASRANARGKYSQDFHHRMIRSLRGRKKMSRGGQKSLPSPDDRSFHPQPTESSPAGQGKNAILFYFYSPGEASRRLLCHLTFSAQLAVPGLALSISSREGWKALVGSSKPQAEKSQHHSLG